MRAEASVSTAKQPALHGRDLFDTTPGIYYNLWE